ncbi:hypothetical protein J4411_02060 [Candidatus Pacearchaeota archaeon]|nr:hypothetical protein [Candidatus Pacearchaeota archaeon]
MADTQNPLDFIPDAQSTLPPTLFKALDIQKAIFNAGIVANKVEVMPYYLNENGEEMIRTTSTSLDFDL